MRQTVCARTFAAGACMASAIVGPAAAQTIEYRTTDLGNMRFLPNPDDTGTFGINNKGQVAFGLIPAGQSEIQAAVWLPVPDYGLLAGVVILLSPPVGHSLPSILRDVNIDGQFVGQVSGVSP